LQRSSAAFRQSDQKVGVERRSVGGTILRQKKRDVKECSCKKTSEEFENGGWLGGLMSAGKCRGMGSVLCARDVDRLSCWSNGACAGGSSGSDRSMELWKPLMLVDDRVLRPVWIHWARDRLTSSYEAKKYCWKTDRAISRLGRRGNNTQG